MPTIDGFSVELQGQLALLLDEPRLYPNLRLTASGVVVAEEGFEPPTHGL
jgi:hypothetical protein